MRIVTRKMLEKLGNSLISVSRKIYTFPQEKRVIPWFKVHGDQTLRLDYDLDENSIVFDVGGYEGNWASDIFSMYCCSIYIFEPVSDFSDKIKERFAKNPKILIYNFGLANDNLKTEISFDQDSSSVFKKTKNLKEITLVKAADFLSSNNIKKIDLMKINIEGGEYDLLEHLIDSGWIKLTKNIQIQFHDFVPNASEKMIEIQQKLSLTHSLTWQYPFVWENWAMRSPENLSRK